MPRAACSHGLTPRAAPQLWARRTGSKATSRLFPLNGARRLRCDVVHNAVDGADLREDNNKCEHNRKRVYNNQRKCANNRCACATASNKLTHSAHVHACVHTASNAYLVADAGGHLAQELGLKAVPVGRHAI
eukprot:351299-Chlamydomonas_euryale.AAC.8